jgi:hypothetical protein
MAASSNIQTMNSDRDRNRNRVYALRQKMFGSYVPNMGTEIQSRTASIVDESTEPLRNKVFSLFKQLGIKITYAYFHSGLIYQIEYGDEGFIIGVRYVHTCKQ